MKKIRMIVGILIIMVALGIGIFFLIPKDNHVESIIVEEGSVPTISFVLDKAFTTSQEEVWNGAIKMTCIYYDPQELKESDLNKYVKYLEMVEHFEKPEGEMDYTDVTGVSKYVADGNYELNVVFYRGPEEAYIQYYQLPMEFLDDVVTRE